MRFPLRILFTVVTLCAATLAVLMANWTVVEISLETWLCILVCFATTNAITEKGAKRIFWTGLIMFAMGYAISAGIPRHLFGESAIPWGPAAASEVLLSRVEVSPQPGTKVKADWQGVEYPAVVRDRDERDRFYVVWVDGSQPRWLLANQVRVDLSVGRRSAHLVLATLFGLLGGCVCSAVFIRKGNATAKHDFLTR